MDPIALIQNYGLEYLKKYYSIYRAIVLDNKDPLYLNRLKVMIPVVSEELKIWVTPKNGCIGGNNYGVRGPLPIPGEVVWVELEKGNPLQGVWDYHSWAKNEVPEEFQNYDVIGVITSGDNRIYLNDSTGELTLYLQGKVNISIADSDGISFTMDKEKIVFNGGNNGEVINISSFMSLVQAIIKDLTPLASGVNTSTWLSQNMDAIKDTKLYH